MLTNLIMPHKVFIHIGTHKTGTSSIQDVLRNQTGRPAIHFFDERLISQYAGTEDEIPRDLVARARTDFQRFLRSISQSSDLPVVISSESYAGNAYQGLANAGRYARALSRVTEGSLVNIVVYLRRQDTFLESLYTQSIHEGGTETFAEFVARHEHVRWDWNLLLDAYRQEFGDEQILVKTFDPVRLRQVGGLIQDFGTTIGAPGFAPAGQISRNTGYSRDALELALISNQVLDAEKVQRMRFLLQSVAGKTTGQNYDYFTFEERSGFLDTYHKNNEKIARDFMGNTSEDLFPEPVPEPDGSSYPGLDLQAALRILLPIIMELEDRQHSPILRLVRLIERKALSLLSRFPNARQKLYLLLKRIRLHS